MVFYAVIPAGGVGSRLWPISRQSQPKFLLDLDASGATMLQASVQRLAGISDGIVVVTGQRYAGAVADQLPELAASNILAEPSGKDSMAAIGLAAAVLVQRFPDDDVVIGSFAADHIISPVDTFHAAITAAIARAQQDEVVAVGVRPRWASSAFGYVRFDSATKLAPMSYPVLEFVEKPDTTTAQKYLSIGEYAWNAGIYVARAQVLLDHLGNFQPELAAGLIRIAAAWDTPQRDRVLAEIWPTLPKIAIDHAISEPLAAQGGMSMIQADFAWEDVGDFDALAGITQPVDDAGTRLITTEGSEVTVHNHGAQDALIIVADGSTDQVLTLGKIPGLVVVKTADALLITTREDAQGVKQIVDHLAQSGGQQWL